MTVDIHDPITEICERLGYSPDYVYRLDIEPTHLTVYAYRGKDGFCQGAKFVDEDGEVAVEPSHTVVVKT